MIYRVEIWIFGKGYYTALENGKKQAVAKQVEILSHFSWYDLSTYEATIKRLV